MRHHLKRVWRGKGFRFAVVGGLNTIWGFLSYPLFYLILHPAGVGYIWVLVVSYVFNMTIAYALQKHLVFRTHGNYIREYLRFVAVQGVFFAVNVLFLPLAVSFLKLNPMIGQTIFAVIIAGVGFFWHDKITFTPRKNRKPKDQLSARESRPDEDQ